MFISRSTRGFYNAAIHADMPGDVVEITRERYVELMAGQSAGQVIDWDDQGQPALIDPQPMLMTVEQMIAIERGWRDSALSASEWLGVRHREEQDLGMQQTLTVEQYTELLAYRQALRDWPMSVGFPDPQNRPSMPGWIAEQTQ